MFIRISKLDTEERRIEHPNMTKLNPAPPEERPQRAESTSSEVKCYDREQKETQVNHGPMDSYVVTMVSIVL